MEVNEDDVIVNTDHNIPADTTDIYQLQRARALRGCSAIIFGSNLPMILANEIE